MGLFNKQKEPVFLKETSNARMQLDKLEALKPLVNEDGKKILEQDIRYLKYGIQGENNIAFELKNSHMPLYILHDIYFEKEGLTAQIDYLVFTRKICFVIECKNMYGNISITDTGAFIRETEIGRMKKREGIFSPITQNQHHLGLLKNYADAQKNSLFKKLNSNVFEEEYKSLVVLSNPKTILRASHAPNEIKGQVVRTDNLITYIKEIYKKSNVAEKSDEKLKEWAESYLRLHKENEQSYTKKYDKYLLQSKQEIEIIERQSIRAVVEEVAVLSEKNETEVLTLENTPLYEELRNYRYNKSKEEAVKPYFLFNNEQLKALIEKMPATGDELKQVKGFGEKKTKKYGQEILEILNKYR